MYFCQLPLRHFLQPRKRSPSGGWGGLRQGGQVFCLAHTPVGISGSVSSMGYSGRSRLFGRVDKPPGGPDGDFSPRANISSVQTQMQRREPFLFNLLHLSLAHARALSLQLFVCVVLFVCSRVSSTSACGCVPVG